MLRESPKMSFQTFSPQFEKTNSFIAKFPHQRDETQLSGALRTKKIRISQKPNESVLSKTEPSAIFSQTVQGFHKQQSIRLENRKIEYKQQLLPQVELKPSKLIKLDVLGGNTAQYES